MSSRPSTAKRPAYSASSAVEALGRALLEIKIEDGLTWADMGAVLGKSEDQAAKYADGSATMDVVTFGRARREWNGRFTRFYDQLCEAQPALSGADDQRGQTSILAAALALSSALEDGKVEAAEVRANRKKLENARDAIEAQLAKLGPLGDVA